MTVPALPERLDDGDLSFRLLHRPARRSLEITVERDASLSVKVPNGATVEEVTRHIRRKRPWIFAKLAEKDALAHPPVVKEIVDGEGFAYLGRNYRLLLVNDQDVPVKLERGRLRLRRNERARGATALRRWYEQTGAAWVARRIGPWARRLGITETDVCVTSLGYRWGSVSPAERINLHWATLQLPPNLIDYVLVHELAHLSERNHTPTFWKLVEQTMPDYKQRREELASRGTQLWLGEVK